MNGKPGLPGEYLPSPVLWPLLSSGNLLPQALVFWFTTRFPFQQSLCSSRRIGTWLGLDIYTSLSLKFSLLLSLAQFIQWQCSCGQDGGDGTYLLVLIKPQLWGLCFFNISSISVLLSGVAASDLALMLIVCEILGKVDWYVDQVLFLKKIILFYYKVIL